MERKKVINTDHLSQCIKTLESSLIRLQASAPNSIDYEIFRNATIKGFELTLETAGKLLRKALKAYSSNPAFVDELTYKDTLRHAVKHGLLSVEVIKHWFAYRDNRNNTAHDYGVFFAETTLKLLPQFLVDAKELQRVLQEKLGATDA
ncbi:MAG: nucleotidyltransferase [Gammaproteobacteria bacterium]|nr:MAG: nucleotidyltransferase [Gammaproteobacteria bacterium]